MPTTIYRRFKKQQYHAKARGIAWELTYVEWLQIWHASGHFEERGCKAGQYVMARHNDVGGYAVGNVAIVLCNENNKAASQLGNIKQWGPVENWRGGWPKKGRPKRLKAPSTIAEELQQVWIDQAQRGWPGMARPRRSKSSVLD
jgi:hypothetical protein